MIVINAENLSRFRAVIAEGSGAIQFMFEFMMSFSHNGNTMSLCLLGLAYNSVILFYRFGKH